MADSHIYPWVQETKCCKITTLINDSSDLVVKIGDDIAMGEQVTPVAPRPDGVAAS